MTALSRTLEPGVLPDRERFILPAGLVILTIAGAALGVVLWLYPPPLPVVLAGSIGLSGMLALAVARYDLAVGLGILMLGIVRFEPAPPDAIFAIVIAVAAVTGRFRLEGVPLGILAVLAVFFTLTIFSAVEAVAPGRALIYMTITMYLITFSVWFAGYIDSSRKTRMLVVAYVTCSLVFAFLSTVALFAPFPGGELLLSADGLRAQALFQDPNVYGPFLIPAALIVLEELINPRLLRMSAGFKWIVFVVLVLGILFSYSRAAWASTVLGVIILLVVLSMRKGGSRRAFLALLAITVVAMVTVTVISATGSLGFLQERATLQKYDSERFLAQRTGLELAFQKPVGIGPGQFETISIVATGNTYELATHSIYVRALAEQGLFGLLSLLAILLGTLVLAARNVVEGRDTYGIGSAALLASWMGLMVNSAVVDTAHWRHLWLVAALIWAGATRPMDEAERQHKKLA